MTDHAGKLERARARRLAPPCNHVDFLLECIGFPPSHDFGELAEIAAAQGEPIAWRGPLGLHRSLELGDGLAVHVDREVGERGPTLTPFARGGCRLRIAVESLRTPPDSPCDAVLVGWPLAAPGARSDPEHGHGHAGLGLGTTRIGMLLRDARRLPRRIPSGHVLAVSVAGFALHVEALQRDADRSLAIRALTGPDDPAGCVEIAAPIERVVDLRNPLTGACTQRVDIALDHKRLLGLHLSPWQLFEEGLRTPRAGDRIEGTFLLSGRVRGGLPSVRRRVGACFG